MVDLSLPVVTKSGREARVICADRKSAAFPVVALVSTADGEAVGQFALDGSSAESPGVLDLVNSDEAPRRLIARAALRALWSAAMLASAAYWVYYEGLGNGF